MEKQVTAPRGGHLEALLNGCPDAIIAINAEGVIKFANKEACKLTGREMNELIGMSIVEVYETLELAKETNRKLYQGGGTIHDHESRVRTKSGKIIPVRISASHLKDSTGKYIGGVGYFAQYRPWTGAEAETKARVEELETRLERIKSQAEPAFELYPGLSIEVVVGQIDTERFNDISDNLLQHVELAGTRAMLLDLSSAVIEDNEVVRQLAKTMRTAKLMGAEIIIAGIPVTLARALEPLLLDLGSVKSYSSLKIGLEEAFKAIGYEIRQKA